MKYKVIRSFEELEKGDIFVEIENGDFKCNKTIEHEDCVEELTITLNKEYVDYLLEEDVVIEITDKKINEDTKLEEVKRYIETLLTTYEEDYNEMLEAFKNGDVQPCVKVEAETVYFNLTKVLNSLLDCINE